MARLINMDKSPIAKSVGEIFINDISVIGFTIDEISYTVNFYYLLIDHTSHDRYLVKQSYLLNENNLKDEILYLNHPLHIKWNISSSSNDFRDMISKVLSSFNSTNSFYCDFKPIDIKEDIVSCNMYQIDAMKSQKYKKVSMPINVYIKLEYIKNKIVFKQPLNTLIDEDTSYDNIEIINNVNITTLGVDNIVDDKLMVFYSIRYNDRTSGLFLPIIPISDRILVAKHMDSKSFETLYRDNFPATMDNIMVLYIKEDMMMKSRIAVNRLIPGGKRIIYIINQPIEESTLLNPYLGIYK